MQSLRDMHQSDKNAVALYLHIWSRAKTPVVRTYRHRLSVSMSMSIQRVKHALSALKAGGWIKRRDTRVKDTAGKYSQRMKIVLLREIQKDFPQEPSRLSPTTEQAPILPNWTNETI